MAFDLDREIEKAKRRLRAHIYGYEPMRVVVDSLESPNPRRSRITVGEYELANITSIDLSMRPDRQHELTIRFIVDDVRIKTIKR